MGLGYFSWLEDASARETAWSSRLRKQVKRGQALFEKLDVVRQKKLRELFDEKVRTEEIKAWYGAPDGDTLFQGTSITSLSVPHVVDEPIPLQNIAHLEECIADAYIESHDSREAAVRTANIENVDRWMSEGLYFGIGIASKIVSQAFGLVAPVKDLVFAVDGVTVDPHEIMNYSPEIRKKYFEVCRERVQCISDFSPNQIEFEQSLAIADISKPKIGIYSENLLLGPISCNEIAATLSKNVTVLIREKTNKRINPRSILIFIYDTDTPFTYHQLAGYYGHSQCPVLPGITLLGSSGTIDAFRWLYIYRCSLVAQKIMKSSLYSEVHRAFMPFVFFGVLVERDAEILIDLNCLGQLRYRGNLSPYIEYSYLLPGLEDQWQNTPRLCVEKELESRLP
ncbi:MAG: hypothetical protein CMF69_08935 [Magnetovibrio sp.]|nr:hypothetical protein [Magnetovibrio sp.]